MKTLYAISLEKEIVCSDTDPFTEIYEETVTENRAQLEKVHMSIVSFIELYEMREAQALKTIEKYRELLINQIDRVMT